MVRAKPRPHRLLQMVAVLCIAASAGLGSALARANELVVGRAAPPLVLQTLDGRSIDTRDLLGQVVIVTFWATWCEPCREELPLFSRYAEQHAAQGLQILGFSLDGPDQLPKVRNVASTLRFPVGLLGSAWAGGYGRVWSLPVSFVIDRDGRLVYNGWEDPDPVWTEERLHRIVDPLIAANRQMRDSARTTAAPIETHAH